jgi:DDE family transposase
MVVAAGVCVPLSRIEQRLAELLAGVRPAPDSPTSRGRPRILPAALLWIGVAVGVLRGFTAQQQIWRLLSVTGLWNYLRVPVTDKALYKRIGATGGTELATLFTDITAHLLATTPAPVTLAPFAREIVVLDETTLDAVARTLPCLRSVPDGDRQLLPGKLAAVFDVRRQLFRTVQQIPTPVQNEKVAARALLDTVPTGSLILADLGYFGFRWFDELTAQGYCWISRLRAKTSTTVQHVLYTDAAVTDALVWLGAYRADRARYLVRMVTIQRGATVHRLLTNVCDPGQLAVADIVALYGERWTIEQAFKLIKRDLKLHLLWSANPNVITTQVWAVLLIAQVLGAIRAELAARAQVPIAEVSLPLLIELLPALAERHPDPLALLAAEGRRCHVIRPTRRVPRRVPPLALTAYRPPPSTLPTERVPRYGEELRRHRISRN